MYSFTIEVLVEKDIVLTAVFLQRLEDFVFGSAISHHSWYQHEE